MTLLGPAFRPLILFRADMGPGSGLGHFSRCAALATAVERAGGRCAFIVENENVGVVRARGFNTILCSPPGVGDPLGILEARRPPATALVVDSYSLDRSALEILHASFPVLVVIDDLAQSYSPADLVVNGAAHAPHLQYAREGVGEVLAGPEYVLLSPGQGAQTPDPSPPEVRSILVATGGGDPLKIMEDLLKTVRSAVGEGPRIEAIIGPYFETGWFAPSALTTWDEMGVGLHRAPDDLGPFIRAADLAVTAAGLILYELAAGAVPTVAFSVADNQQPQLAVLANRRALLSAGDAREPGFLERLLPIVAETATSRAKREQLGRQARAIVDGRGADRVARRLLELAVCP